MFVVLMLLILNVHLLFRIMPRRKSTARYYEQRRPRQTSESPRRRQFGSATVVQWVLMGVADGCGCARCRCRCSLARGSFATAALSSGVCCHCLVGWSPLRTAAAIGVACSDVRSLVVHCLQGHCLVIVEGDAITGSMLLERRRGRGAVAAAVAAECRPASKSDAAALLFASLLQNVWMN